MTVNTNRLRYIPRRSSKNCDLQFVNSNRQTDRQTDRQADRQTDRHTVTHRHTDRQTDRFKENCSTVVPVSVMNGHPRDKAKVSVHCRWPLVSGTDRQAGDAKYNTPCNTT